MRRGRVPQPVGRDVVNSRELAHLVDRGPHLALVYAPATLTKEQRAIGAVTHKLGTATIQPFE